MVCKSSMFSEVVDSSCIHPELSLSEKCLCNYSKIFNNYQSPCSSEQSVQSFLSMNNNNMSDIIRSSEEMKKIIGLYLLGQTDIADIMFKHIINEYRAECNIIMKNMVDEYYKGNVPQITTIPELSEEGKKYHLNKAFICPNYKYKSIFFELS